MIETIAYGYSNTQWGDLLTSFNGSTITYDAMGNPTSYLGKTLTWDGKKLAKTEFGSGTSYYYYEYKYDENGLRTRKTLTVPALSLSETTEYFYNGSVLIGMKIGMGSGAKILRFSYDANGSVVAVDYSTDNGSSFTTYYYLRNAQNDIVKIIDSTGTAVVEYIYDSWGKALSVTGSLTNSLGMDQPFRYRGYVYDTETQWYYLQSRYYDPNTCRFISADVLLSTGQGVIGHNSFAYCLNTPINGYDSDGTYYRIFNVCKECTDGNNGYKRWKERKLIRTKIYYDTIDEAAIAFAKIANYDTIALHKEFASLIVAEYVDGKTKYTLFPIEIGEHDNVILYYITNTFFTLNCVAFVHTHPYCSGHCGGERENKRNSAWFSWGDCLTSIGKYCYCSDVGSGKLFRIRNEFWGIFTGGVSCFDSADLIYSGLPSTSVLYMCD